MLLGTDAINGYRYGRIMIMRACYYTEKTATPGAVGTSNTTYNLDAGNAYCKFLFGQMGVDCLANKTCEPEIERAPKRLLAPQ